MQIFNQKQGTERHLSQLFFVICCFTSVECYIMLPFKHIHMLIEQLTQKDRSRQELITRSVQLSYYAYVTAFLQPVYF